MEGFSGSTIKDATAEGGGSQGFCDDRTMSLVLKSVAMGEGVKSCVTSLMDNPIAPFVRELK
jgi:hypothetical protein